MSYSPEVLKTLKVARRGFVNPTSASEYAVGSIFSYGSDQYQYYPGNLSDLVYNTHTNSNDTIVLPAGRYVVQSMIPCVEGYEISGMTNLAFVEWKLFSSSSLNGTYSSFGLPGRNNPGNYANDVTDTPGVHSYATGLVESSSTIYLQTRITTNSSYNSLGNGWFSLSNIVIWRAD